jgi:protein ImuB
MYAALHLLDLPVTAALRHSTAEQRLPWGVLPVNREIDDRAAKLPLLALNEAARRTGIEAGWPLNRALVRCPGLKIAPRQPEEERALLEELIFLGESLTPDLEITSPDTLLLDLSGSPAWINEALAKLDLRGATLCHAWAETPDLAKLAVLQRETRGRTVGPADLERLDISLLRLLDGAEELLPLLDIWGVRTAGDYLRLPRQQLAERLGAMAGHWHDLLHGKVDRPLKLHRPPESFSQEMDFECPMDGTDALLFLLKRLLHTLAGRLEARHLAACSLHLHLRLESGAGYARKIRLPEPLTDAAAMIRPIQTLVDQLQLEAPVVGLTLDAEATFPGSVQREWFSRQLADPARWADTLARLDGLLGAGRTGIPVPPDSYLPERFTLRPAPGSASVLSSPPPPRMASLPDSPVPLRRFRPAHPIAVAHEMPQPQRPIPLALLSGPYTGQILERRGPYLSSGQWWDPEAEWKRMEWDIRLPQQRIVRLVYVPPDQWQLDGIYT